MARVALESITRHFPGTPRPAVNDLSIDIADGEFLVLVGPSGCGKSTTLRMAAGLEPVDAGTIRIGDTDVTVLPPRRRDIAMIFQSYALYPHLTVFDNIGFHLKLSKVPKAEIRERVLKVANMLELTDYLERKPAKLSGGQRQRVAMGRAIIREPKAFLMDEPLSNLDAKLRLEVRAQIAELQRRLGTTTIYVTHDQVEAMTMGDRVAVLKDGDLLQCASPEVLYSEPVNVFVAGFIGSPPMNLLRVGSAGQGSIDLFGRRFALPPDTGGGVIVGIRPEDLRLSGDDGVSADVELVENLGFESLLHCVVRAPGDPLDGQRVVVRHDAVSTVARGARISIETGPGAVPHVFDETSEQRVGSARAGD